MRLRQPCFELAKMLIGQMFFWLKYVEPLRLPFELIWRRNCLDDQNCKKITFSKIRVTRRLGKKLAQRLVKVAKTVAKPKMSIYVHQSSIWKSTRTASNHLWKLNISTTKSIFKNYSNWHWKKLPKMSPFLGCLLNVI